MDIERYSLQDWASRSTRESEIRDEAIVDQVDLADLPSEQDRIPEEASKTILAKAEDTSTNGPSKRKRDQDSGITLARGDGTAVLFQATATDLDRTGPVTDYNVKRLKSDVLGAQVARKGFQLDGTYRVDDMLHGLTVSIWQRILCFVPPVFLGRLLRVDRAFHALLNQSGTLTYHASEPSSNASQTHISQPVWTASRKRFAPGLPRALFGQSELDMWRLLRGNSCQICGERKSLMQTSTTSDPWHAGPGRSGVRVIWSFGIRSCGPCLFNCSEQEVALLFSSTFPSFLLSALPCAYFTQSQDYIAAASIRSGALPPDIQIAKYYFKPHIQEIKRRFEEVKLLGTGSAEEWIKGLDSEGKDRSQDAVRWEQWEAKGGLKKVNTRPNLKTTPGARQTTVASMPAVDGSTPNIGFEPTEVQTGTSSFSNMAVTTHPLIASFAPDTTFVPPRHVVAVLPGGLPQRPHVHIPQVKHDRNIRSVNEAKAARRAEIERRCLGLDPPIEPAVLCHMESFQAALQISTVLTEAAWEVLKPRLLSQRQAAEQRENGRLEQNRILQAKSEERKQEDAQLKEAKEIQDREWDVAQTPVRERLARYADKIIRDVWSGGTRVTKDNCSKFAADILIHCRQRFHDDLAQEGMAKHVASRSTKLDALDHSLCQKLNLENMKWLFDNKIKNVTEQFQKELFLCNGCEGNFKFYGFEAVIQHYAAKHTSALSRGSVVVHWRADWPENPPFHPNPSSAKAAYYAIPMPPITIGPPEHNRPTQASSGYADYGHGFKPMTSVAPTIFNTNDHTGGPYLQSQQVQFQSPDVVQQSVMTQPTHTFGLEFHGQHPSYRPLSSYPTTSETAYVPQSLSTHSPATRLVPNSSVMHTPATFGLPVPMVGSEQYYQTQLNEMAKHARDVWFGTSGIKDIPQSVRIFVVIQHVVSRFEQRYTNEPSLSMFIDGLDHNALMRPVRSLNGLACQACVANFMHANTDFHSHPQHSAIDRKLYTLPHLLNHFRSVHVEKARTTVDLQTGMDSSRLDWKRDMIELPETSLIADLINAPGMDDTKLQLISKVFPGVFPDPLPSLGVVMNAGPVPKYKPGHMSPLFPERNCDQVASALQTPYHLDPASSRTDNEPSGLQSTLGDRAHSSPRVSEPPGEDEYDPNRPTYLGRIVESYQIDSSRRMSLARGATKEEEPGPGPGTSLARYIRNRVTDEVQSRTEGAYGNQLLRHYNRSAQITTDETQASDPTSRQSGRLSIGGQRPDNGGMQSTRSLAHETQSPKAEIAAADKFLENLTPAIESIGYGRNLRTERQISVQPSTYNQRGKRSPSSSKHDLLDDNPKRGYLAEPSARTTPSYVERLEDRGITSMQALNNHAQYRDHHLSAPTVQYFYTDGETSVGRTLPYGYDERISSSVHSRNEEIARTNGPSRSLVEPSSWPEIARPWDRSMSPGHSPNEFAHYRVQSPCQPIRHDTVYRVRSPHESTFNEARPRRTLQYSYPQPQDRYGMENGFAQDIQDRHVEYMISPESVSCRYAVTPNHRTASKPMRVECNYEPQRVYERGGTLYYTESQPYTTRTRRPLEPEYVEYQDY